MQSLAANDYMRFLRMLANKGELDGVRVLGRKTVEYAMRNHLTDQRANEGKSFQDFNAAGFLSTNRSGQGYSLLGSCVIDPSAYATLSSIGENAWGGAASTYWWVDPEEDICVLQISQLLPSRMYNWRRELHALVYQALVDEGSGAEKSSRL